MRIVNLVVMITIIATSILIITESKGKLEANQDTTVPVIPINPIIPLLSDVRLSYSSFIGGSTYDKGNCITIDDNGYIWVVGASTSSNYPTAGFKGVDTSHNSLGLYDIVVSKFSPDGEDLILSTFVGGDGVDFPNDATVDHEGNLWIVGHTASTTFPVSPDALNSTHGSVDSIDPIFDGFICKLSGTTGALLYSTYLATNPISAIITSCAFDSNGNFWFTGCTNSSGFPTTSTAYDPDKTGLDWDIFLSKLSSDGTQLLYSTFFGGSEEDRVE